LYPLLAPRAHRIDQAHFERIAKGMTREQVESIFGAAPGEYDWAEPDQVAVYVHRIRAAHDLLAITITEQAVVHNSDVIRVGPRHSLVWTSRHGAFFVDFDVDDRVVSAPFSSEVRIVPPWQRWRRAWNK
jgi:transcriptional regulator with XRE-family HTH domain